LFDNIDRLGAA